MARLSHTKSHKSHTKTYISPICPEVPSELIFTKFGTNVPLVEVINSDKLCVNLFTGFDFTGGGQSFNFPTPVFYVPWNSVPLFLLWYFCVILCLLSLGCSCYVVSTCFRRVLRSSSPYDQDCWYIDLVG